MPRYKYLNRSMNEPHILDSYLLGYFCDSITYGRRYTANSMDILMMVWWVERAQEIIIPLYYYNRLFRENKTQEIHSGYLLFSRYYRISMRNKVKCVYIFVNTGHHRKVESVFYSKHIDEAIISKRIDEVVLNYYQCCLCKLNNYVYNS